MIEDQNRFDKVIHTIDQANLADPNQEEWEGQTHAKEWLYAQRMTQWLNKVYPEASEELRIAAHAQHICRWEIPRSDYPMGKVGYHQWRTSLQQFHADKTGQILEAEAYQTDQITRVQQLLKKKNLRKDPECQQLEDIICLVFLDYYFAPFAAKHEDQKVIDILRKTWRKMSAYGQGEALKIEYPDKAKSLIEQALAVN
ncbi:MAG: DUF4202 domain-containing protein [Saprospiraceae bacterium]|nr:DUF4202 domain-containing protein [Saprospiraceae bacterium]